MLFCKFCQDFSVQTDFCGFQHANETGVGKAEFPNGGIDLQVPEIPEAALLGAAVTEGVDASFQHGWASKTDLALASPLVTLYALQEILAALYMLCPTFDSWHRLKVIRETGLYSAAQCFWHGYVRALHAGNVSAFPGIKMVLAGFPLGDFTGAGDLYALHERFVGLHRHTGWGK